MSLIDFKFYSESNHTLRCESEGLAYEISANGFLSVKRSLADCDIPQCLRRCMGHYKVLSFSYGDQFLCLAVAFDQVLSRQAGKLYADEDFCVKLDQAVYSVDYTIINTCLRLFPWVGFLKTKSAVKLHILHDWRGIRTTLVVITPGKFHDIKILDQLIFEPGSIRINDRGYLDYARLYRFQICSAFFVTRAKNTFEFRRLYLHPLDETTGLECDQIIALTDYYFRRDYPDKLRRVGYLDSEQGKVLMA